MEYTEMIDKVKALAAQNRAAKTAEAKAEVRRQMDALKESDPKAFAVAVGYMAKTTEQKVKELTMADRFTMANMAIECGAKNGIFSVDKTTIDYLNKTTNRPYEVFYADDDAEYEREVNINLNELAPIVALPHLPSNTKSVDKVKGMHIDQVIIGSCTNGRIEDLRVAAEIMRGKKIAKNVRCIIIPASQQIYLDAVNEGLVNIFINAGAVFSTPTCGPCIGGHMGVMASGERAVSTTNRNFVGRMGHKTSEVILASPAVAAASAISGVLASPIDLIIEGAF